LVVVSGLGSKLKVVHVRNAAHVLKATGICRVHELAALALPIAG